MNKTFLEVLLNILEEFFMFFLREGIDGPNRGVFPSSRSMAQL